MQRISEIPAEIRLLNPTYEEVQLANGLVRIAPRSRIGPPVKATIILSMHPEAVRARIWQSIKNCIFGKILIEDKAADVINDAVDRAPVEGAAPNNPSGLITTENALRVPTLPKEPVVPAADFSGIPGIQPLTAKRITALGIRTFEQFLDLDVKVLAKIEGINPENLDAIIAAVAAKITVPDPATITPEPPPAAKSMDIIPGTETVSAAL